MEPDAQAVSAWLEEDFLLRIAARCEEGQWYALLMDFDITGAGGSLSAAVRDSLDLLGAYLEAYRVEGVPFRQTLRPIPLPLRLRIRFESVLARAFRRLRLHVRGLECEETYRMPMGAAALAH